MYGFFVSHEVSSVRDYVITHSVRSMCMYICMCMYVVFCKIDHYIHIHWCIVMGLGHNDPWVESHTWPQQTWGQRSSRGQWSLVQVFGKKGQCIHILWCISKSNILQWLQKYVIAKAGETRGSRTTLFFFFVSCQSIPVFSSYPESILLFLNCVERLILQMIGKCLKVDEVIHQVFKKRERWIIVLDAIGL